MIDLWIVGAGGHARVVYDSATSTGRYRVRAFIDDNPAMWDSTIDSIPVIGPISAETIARHGVTSAVLGIGNNTLRATLAERLRAVPVWATIVHARAYVAASSSLGPGTVVFAGSVVQTETVTGNHVIINTNSTVDHDARLDDFCHVASARIGGRTHIETGAMICIGAVIIPGVSIGAWSTIGAGGVATRDVPAGVLAVGVPAVVKSAVPTPAQPERPPVTLVPVGSPS